ncbi:MAG TPA: type II toxin-antitoxin system VapC family toxin [Candidatus Sulfotelmatobacter sp.]
MILLDTHVLLWMASDPSCLSRAAREAIRRNREQSGIAVAAITLWELSWLAQNNRIVVTGSVESFVRETVARVILRPITPEIAAQAARLPRQFPRDPADRLIAATALIEGAPLITADKSIRQSELLPTIW